MKAVCNREGLLSALLAARAVVPSRPAKPVLRNVLLVLAGDGPSEAVATDLEVGLRRRILGAKVEQPGSVLVEAARAVSIFKAMVDEEVLLEAAPDGERFVISGMQARFELLTEDVALFPEVATFVATDYWEWRAALVRRAIERTIFATDAASTRYALGGCLLEEHKESKLGLVGTDGRRLALVREHVDRHGKPQVRPSTVIPLKPLKLLLAGLDDEQPPVHMAMTATGVIFRTEFATVSTRLVEGRFPRYEDAIPDVTERVVAVPVADFRRAVEQAAIGASEESRGVEFAFGSDLLTLTAQSDGFGRSRVEFPLAEAGKPVSMLFDPSYLLAMLKVMPGDVTLKFQLGGRERASMLKTEDGCYTYIMMPIVRDASPPAKKGKKAKAEETAAAE